MTGPTVSCSRPAKLSAESEQQPSQSATGCASNRISYIGGSTSSSSSSSGSASMHSSRQPSQQATIMCAATIRTSTGFWSLALRDFWLRVPRNTCNQEAEGSGTGLLGGMQQQQQQADCT